MSTPPPYRPTGDPTGRHQLRQARRAAYPPSRGERRPPTRSGGPGPSTSVRGTRRGLTAFGGALLVLVAGGFGAVADIVVSGKVGLLFGIFFSAGCLLAAGRTHQEDVGWSVVSPPLVYAVLTVVVGFVHPSSGSGESGLRGKAIDIAAELVFKAPVLIIGTLLAAALAIARIRRARAAARDARGGARRAR